MDTFEQDITAWKKKTKLSGRRIMQKIGLDLYSGILKRAPVKTGRFRASNRVTINSKDLSVEPFRPRRISSAGGIRAFSSPTGAELVYATNTLTKIQWQDTIYLTNNLHYARFLENGGSGQNGHMKDGIYGATLSTVRAKIHEAVIKVTKTPDIYGVIT